MAKLRQVCSTHTWEAEDALDELKFSRRWLPHPGLNLRLTVTGFRQRY